MNWMEKAEDLLPQMIEWRRHLHQYPEIGFHEVKTAEYVAGILQAFDLEVHDISYKTKNRGEKNA